MTISIPPISLTRRRVSVYNSSVKLCYCIFLFSLLLFLPLSNSQLSHSPTLTIKDNKFRNNAPSPENEGEVRYFVPQDSECHIDFDLLWKAELGVPVVSTPIITDLFADGSKQIVISTASHYVEILRGEDGSRVVGWPFYFPQSSFIASPLLYDIDLNGENDILLCTQAGEIVFLNDQGVPLYPYTRKIPPLKVSKKWYEGLDDKFIDASMKLHKEEAKQKRSVENLVGEKNSGGTSQFSFEYLFSSEFENVNKTPVFDNDYVYVDSHILAPPVIRDIDKDGHQELVVSVSYFFDPSYYSSRLHLLGDIDIKKYVAGGLVVYDLLTLDVKWSLHLDLTTDLTNFRAYCYSSPVIIDINGDKQFDVLVGTAMGLIYALNGKNGQLIKGFPIVTGPIFSQIVVEDITGDGWLDILVVDGNGNVICFNNDGKENWSRKISGYSDQTPVLGDIDNDGILDVVFGSTSGNVWCLRGDTGEPLKNFPIQLNGKIQSQILLVDLSTRLNEKKGLSLVVHSMNGHLYVIDSNGCSDSIDLGVGSFSAILSGDISSENKLDILTVTKGGSVYCLRTASNYHPLKDWDSQSVVTSRQYSGIYLLEPSRQIRDIIGPTFQLQIEIVDRRFISAHHEFDYTVTVWIGASQIHYEKLSKSGFYVLTVTTPPTRRNALLAVRMMNELGQVYEDKVAISFNMHFYRMIKYVIVSPFIVLILALAFLRELKNAPLPS